MITKKQAVRLVKQAHRSYKTADAHRSEMIELAIALGANPKELRKALELKER